MALPDWAVITGIVAAAMAPIVAAFKVRPEARKYRDDGAAGLTTSAGAIVAAVEHEMAALRADAAARRAENEEMRRWRNDLEQRLRRHSRWDERMVASARARGEEVPDPPRLFDEDEDVSA